MFTALLRVFSVDFYLIYSTSGILLSIKNVLTAGTCTEIALAIRNSATTINTILSIGLLVQQQALYITTRNIRHSTIVRIISIARNASGDTS